MSLLQFVISGPGLHIAHRGEILASRSAHAARYLVLHGLIL